MITHEEFDWSLTDRELVIFMPNWGRGYFIRKTVEVMSTKIPRDRWIIIVGNDYEHEDLSDLKDQNVFYFTYNPDGVRKKERGGSYIRNIAIKRCRSNWFFQRDPEVVIEHDWIENVLNCPTDFYRLSGPAHKVRQKTTEKFIDGNATIEDCKRDSDRIPISPNNFVFFNMAFGVKTKILQNMRGYDEDHWGTYCYDRDLYVRLMAQNIKTTMDPQCQPIHLWHSTPSFPNTKQTIDEYDRMKKLFATKNPKDFTRNINRPWGEGE
jgi:hypothetical protein